jgi:hypothetical protein
MVLLPWTRYSLSPYLHCTMLERGKWCNQSWYKKKKIGAITLYRGPLSFPPKEIFCLETNHFFLLCGEMIIRVFTRNESIFYLLQA